MDTYFEGKLDCSPREKTLYPKGNRLYFKGKKTVPGGKKHCTWREEILYSEGKELRSTHGDSSSSQIYNVFKLYLNAF